MIDASAASYLQLPAHVPGAAHRFTQGPPAGVGAAFRYWSWPDKERTEYFKQRDWVDLLRRPEADTTFRGTRLVDPEDLTKHLHRRDHSWRWCAMAQERHRPLL
jgi:hypothetical protein